MSLAGCKHRTSATNTNCTRPRGQANAISTRNETGVNASSAVSTKVIGQADQKRTWICDHNWSASFIKEAHSHYPSIYERIARSYHNYDPIGMSRKSHFNCNW